MSNIEIYVDKNRNLKIMVRKYDKSDRIDYKLSGDDAKKYIKEISYQDIIDTKDDGYNEFVYFEDFSVRILDYKKILKNKEAYEALMPLLNNVKVYDERRKKLSNKKVQRRNKYAFGTISFVGLTAIVASGIISAAGATNKTSSDISVRKVEAYTEDGLDHYVFEVDRTPEDDMFFDVEENAYYNKAEEEPVIEVDTLQEAKTEEEPVIEESSSIVNEPQEIQEENNYDTVYIDHIDVSKSEKAYSAYLNYFDVISKYARMYGLDEKLMMAVATQENGVHTTDLARPAIGLMAVETYWIGKDITGYNFETQSYKTLHITPENLQNLEFNIEASCILFQNGLMVVDYNPILGLQEYNMGDPNMQIILEAYSQASGRSKEDIINDKTDIGWLAYTHLPGEGDPEYVPNVLSFDGDECTIVNIRPDGVKVGITIKNPEKTKIY